MPIEKALVQVELPVYAISQKTKSIMKKKVKTLLSSKCYIKYLHAKYQIVPEINLVEFIIKARSK